MNAGEFLEWRAGHGLSQSAAAKVLGLSASQVQRIDTGKCPVPGPVAAICRAIDRHPDVIGMLRDET